VLSNLPLPTSAKQQQQRSFPLDETDLCNSCIHDDFNKTQCSNLWCGLPNCKGKLGTMCNSNEKEVCFPALTQTCLSPPCTERGDCRSLEESLRTAPPKYPASSKCWPNQAILSENCSRINIILDMLKIPRGLSTESYCHNLRTLLGGRMVEQKLFSHSTIILICDIKSGTNDTIEVTVVSRQKIWSKLSRHIILSLVMSQWCKKERIGGLIDWSLLNFLTFNRIKIWNLSYLLNSNRN
jgi:hypothetical protein